MGKGIVERVETRFLSPNNNGIQERPVPQEGKEIVHSYWKQ